MYMLAYRKNVCNLNQNPGSSKEDRSDDSTDTDPI